MAQATKYAIVTGANKGIGFEIVRQLASIGSIKVVLAARDEKRGVEAVDKLIREFGISAGNVVFHQLDLSDPASVYALADFIKTQFGKLDILVNNAGVIGANIGEDDYRAANKGGGQVDWKELYRNTSYELSEECLNINYCGTKRMVEAFIPLLQISDSPRIVNVSSSLGKLENVPNEWAKGVLSDAHNLTEERIDEVLHQYLKDYKEGLVESKGWPSFASAYIISKAALNAYTRILAPKFPTFKINSVCPGYVKTDINYNTGFLSVEEGAESPVKLALLPDDGPSGLFFYRKEESDF